MGLLPERNCENCDYANAGLGCEHPDLYGDPNWWQYPQCKGFKARKK